MGIGELRSPDALPEKYNPNKNVLYICYDHGHMINPPWDLIIFKVNFEIMLYVNVWLDCKSVCL